MLVWVDPGLGMGVFLGLASQPTCGSNGIRKGFWAVGVFILGIGSGDVGRVVDSLEEESEGLGWYRSTQGPLMSPETLPLPAKAPAKSQKGVRGSYCKGSPKNNHTYFSAPRASLAWKFWAFTRIKFEIVFYKVTDLELVRLYT